VRGLCVGARVRRLRPMPILKCCAARAARAWRAGRRKATASSARATRALSYSQLVEHDLRLLQIERVEAFGEPAINRSEKIAGVLPLAQSRAMLMAARSSRSRACCPCATWASSGLPELVRRSRLVLELVRGFRRDEGVELCKLGDVLDNERNGYISII
jgi:hypothetical protein